MSACTTPRGRSGGRRRAPRSKAETLRLELAACPTGNATCTAAAPRRPSPDGFEALRDPSVRGKRRAGSIIHTVRRERAMICTLTARRLKPGAYEVVEQLG